MPKPTTFPTLYEDCKTISIASLKRLGYLNINQYNSGVITWRINGDKTASISIIVNTSLENSYIELAYRCNDILIHYRINLISTASNLGKGIIWFFICPKTGKQCKKLHFIDNHFYHRSAFRGCMYEKQTYSHNKRKLFKTLDEAFGVEEALKKIDSKYFKKQYKGRYTKRYLSLLKRTKIDSNY